MSGAARFTVLGASGFIGSRLAAHLRANGHDVDAPARAAANDYIAALRGRDLGHVVYCIGLTADFRTRPYETVEAHVGLLQRVLAEGAFASLTYLSSTRVYQHSARASETTMLGVDPARRDDIFSLSKLLGESLCVNSGRPARVVRPSNVFGAGDPSENFLPSVLREARRSGRVTIKLSPESAKDYVAVEDVVRWIAKIVVGGTAPIYNLASGANTTNGAIAERLKALGVAVDFEVGGETIVFPPIDNTRVTAEFGPPSVSVIEKLPDLLKHQT
jgi:nucleoside-diphosphate-sugar epimerase